MGRALIVQDLQKLLLRDDYPDRITTIIPTAKKINYQGVDLVVVPHGIDEVKVLNNMGYVLPSPVSHYYKWSGQYTPFHAQKVTVDKLTLNPRMFVLNQLGTGKTMSVLWAFDYLRAQGRVKRMILVTPISTMDRVWADEVFRHFPHLTAQVVYNSSAKRRVDMLSYPADIYIINHDAVKIPELHAAIMARDDIDIVVVDEVASFRNASAQRWKMLKKIIDTREYAWGLTGTPTPNSPTDAWAQCRLIVPHRVPQYFGKFRDMVERKVSMFKWVPRDNATEIVRDCMQPAVLFRRDECVDLPPTTYEYRRVDLTADQKRAYKQMMNHLVAEAKAGQIVAVNEAVKAGRLLQIAAGVGYNQEGEAVSFDGSNRLEVVYEIVEQSEGKVIVFIPLLGALESVRAFMLQRGVDVRVVHGGVSKKERDAIFSEFQHPNGPRVLAAHPKCMSHGLTLTESNTIVWFIPTYDNETYEQANGRITRPGQKRNTFIVHIEGSEIERRAYKRLENKGTMQNLLLDLIKEEVGG